MKRLVRCRTAASKLGKTNMNVSVGPDRLVHVTGGDGIDETALKLLCLEPRPFFPNDEPIYFPSLVKLRSFGSAPDVARAFRVHTKRWQHAAFEGKMGMKFGGSCALG